jgi:hypothetical protein
MHFAVMREDAEGSPEDVEESAINAFLDISERRGITEGETDLIWNAMAMLC